MAAVDISVVVPSWGAPPTVGALLSALRAQTLPTDRWEILIVDAGADGGMRMLERLRESWDGAALRLLRGPLAGGPAVRRNHGAANARGALLAFTDTDCEPTPSWLAAGAAAAGEMVQGRTLPPEGADLPPLAHFHSIEADSALYEACNMFYERRLFERLGGFPTRYFPRLLEPFGEDTELGWRARRAGARFCFEPDAVVRHAVVPRRVGAHLRYMWRGRGFPLLVKHAPELRTSFLHRRLFLSRRTARFDAAVAGVLLARRWPAAALLAAPYLHALAATAGPEGAGPAGRVRQVGLAAASDAVLGAGLAYGSVRFGEPVL